ECRVESGVFRCHDERGVRPVRDVRLLLEQSLRSLESLVAQVVRAGLEFDADGCVPPGLEGDVGVQPHKARIRRNGEADARKLADDEVTQVGRTVAEPGIGVVQTEKVLHELPAFGEAANKAVRSSYVSVTTDESATKSFPFATA